MWDSLKDKMPELPQGIAYHLNEDEMRVEEKKESFLDSMIKGMF